MLDGLKTNILFDLYNRICLLLPRIALPIRFYERREGYSGHTMETTMSGLSVRLYEDTRTNLEEGFPSSSTISISGENMVCQIFAFKAGQSEKYRKDEGIVFTINRQTQGHIPVSFFKRKSVGMSYLADSILVTIDCTNFAGSIDQLEELVNNRSRSMKLISGNFLEFHQRVQRLIVLASSGDRPHSSQFPVLDHEEVIVLVYACAAVAWYELDFLPPLQALPHLAFFLKP